MYYNWERTSNFDRVIQPLSVLTFPQMILIHRRGNFVYRNWRVYTIVCAHEEMRVHVCLRVYCVYDLLLVVE